MKKDMTVNGSITIEKIDYNRLLFRKVSKNNNTSGKVNVPVNLIGKEVVIVVPKKGHKRA